MAFFRVGDAVRVKKDMYEWSYGIGLILDKNPKYWFVHFPNGEFIAFKSTQLQKLPFESLEIQGRALSSRDLTTRAPLP